MPDRITKFIESLSAKMRLKLKKKLVALKIDPYGMKDVKKMQGYGENAYRLRMGKLRIVYRIIAENVEIVDIDYRGNIY